jgi:hypothetical protein
MSYYFVADDEPEFMRVQGPYRNKDDLIDALNTISAFAFLLAKATQGSILKNDL